MWHEGALLLMVVIVDKDEKCRSIQRLIDSGKGVCESCREVGVSEKTFYRWRQAISAKSASD